ncbi:MAG: trehalose-phosphatase [Pseudomonadota bacterium]
MLIRPSDALFLDFDGTLVPFAARPESVLVPPALPQTLKRLETALEGALAIVTGRPIGQIDDHLQRAVAHVAGEHGAVLRLDGAARTNPDLPDISALLDSVRCAIAQLEGVWIEQKTAGFAVHFRAHPQAEKTVHGVLETALADSSDFERLLGDHVAEVRAKGVNKGTALRQMMARGPFAGRRPVFIGDDVTDEDGFSAAQALGGFGVKVGPGATCALERLEDCAAVHTSLARCLDRP